MAAAASDTPRRVLLAWSNDWTDVARTLRFTLHRLARPGDRFVLAHVRVAQAPLGPTAVPAVELPVPLSKVLALWHAGDTGPASKAVADALDKLVAAVSSVDAVELRTTLRVSDAIAAYVRFVPPAEEPDLVIMGSHSGRNVGTAHWKAPHISLDVAATQTACPCVLARPREQQMWDVVTFPEWTPPAEGTGAAAAPYVVLALDGSQQSPLQTQYVIANILQPRDAVWIVNKGDTSDSGLNAVLAKCEAMLTTAGHTVKVVRLHADADVRDYLVDLSETGPSVDLGPPVSIVVGTRGEATSSLKRLVLGGTADYVLRMAATTVVAVPPLVELTPGAPGAAL